MKALCIALVSFALVSCGRSSSPSAKQAPEPTTTSAASAGSISANPNPVPPGPGQGQTTITWTTGSSEWGQVYVSKNRRAEQLFAGGSSGAKLVKWIQPNAHYDFRLYEGKGHQKLLGKVEVTHHS